MERSLLTVMTNLTTQRDNMENIIVERLTNVDLPKKAHATDAGLDFYIPRDLNYVVKNGKNINIGLYTRNMEPAGDVITSTAIEIRPHESCLIPMGIKVRFNPGWALVFFNRSGIATKKHLLRGACIVDSSYRGEVFVNINNVSNNTQYLLPGDKLIQAMLLPVPVVTVEEGKVENDTERGEGGFGSSDK